MTGYRSAGETVGGGLLARVMAAVRPEFRGEVLVFDADDPVFGGGACQIGPCRRPARGRGLCPGHLQRWVKQGRPDLEQVHRGHRSDLGAAASEPAMRHRRLPLRLGTGRHVLLARSALGPGRPDREAWIAAATLAFAPAVGAVCRIDWCEIWPQRTSPFCHAHHTAWKANGRGDIDAFATAFGRVGPTEDETVRLGLLGPQLRLEIAYALQCRRDERSSKTFPTVVMQVVQSLARTEVMSLLEHSEDEWRGLIRRPAPKDSTPRAFLIYARRRVADLAGGAAGTRNIPATFGSCAGSGLPATRPSTSP